MSASRDIPDGVTYAHTSNVYVVVGAVSDRVTQEGPSNGPVKELEVPLTCSNQTNHGCLVSSIRAREHHVSQLCVI